MNNAQFKERILEHQAKVGVIGLGYVGLPLIIEFCKVGFPVLGFDLDEKKVEALLAGRSYIKHIPAEQVRTLNSSGRFDATTDFSRVGEADALIICVPTPLTAQREPDVSYIVNTGEMIVPFMRKNQLVVLESTTYPGTTREVLKPILEKNGLRAGDDFYLAFSPEREDPGNPVYSTSKIPKVIGGLDPASLEVAEAFYSQIVVGTVPVSSMDVAEAVKLTENIFRSVNIAMVNELKTIYSKMGIDVWEVIDAAKTKPFGFMPFYPGPGLGGHCIPIDPFYLTWKAREYECATRFIELAGEVNTSMPSYVVTVLMEALNQRKKSLNGSRILLLGIAYKRDVDDMRESPSLRLINLLRQKGAQVDYYDPYIPVIPPTREHSALAGEESIKWDMAAISKYDAVLISTDHTQIDYNVLVKAAQLVIDTRNATRDVVEGREKIVKA
ncbi:MAG TPA: nucleotide sugar dehydrogenase [Thermodesulfobacteriota bacterium]|nr:nucleotide sugar dehydrogenase [Thermodesulfobacteriota bacterium]